MCIFFEEEKVSQFTYLMKGGCEMVVVASGEIPSKHLPVQSQQ